MGGEIATGLRCEIYIFKKHVLIAMSILLAFIIFAAETHFRQKKI